MTPPNAMWQQILLLAPAHLTPSSHHLTPCPLSLLAQTRLMTPPNATWQQILLQARSNPDILKQHEVIKSIQNVLQTNVSVRGQGWCWGSSSEYLRAGGRGQGAGLDRMSFTLCKAPGVTLRRWPGRCCCWACPVLTVFNVNV